MRMKMQKNRTYKGLRAALVCLLLSAALCFAGCGGEAGGSTASSAIPEKIGKATLEYAFTREGTCWVTGIWNPEGAARLSVEVPAEYRGARVVGFSPENLLYPVPTMVPGEAFEALLDAFAETVNAESRENPAYKELNWRDYREISRRNRAAEDSGNPEWYDFMRFFSYYSYKCREECSTEREWQSMRNAYPITEIMPIYVLTVSSIEEIQILYGLMRQYIPSWRGDEILTYAEQTENDRVLPDQVVASQIVSLSLPESIETIGGEGSPPFAMTGIRTLDIPRSVTEGTDFLQCLTSVEELTWGGEPFGLVTENSCQVFVTPAQTLLRGKNGFPGHYRFVADRNNGETAHELIRAFFETASSAIDKRYAFGSFVIDSAEKFRAVCAAAAEQEACAEEKVCGGNWKELQNDPQYGDGFFQSKRMAVVVGYSPAADVEGHTFAVTEKGIVISGAADKGKATARQGLVQLIPINPESKVPNLVYFSDKEKELIQQFDEHPEYYLQ